MGVIVHDYLDERMLKGLAAYKYKAAGYTWLDDLHNPAWNWIVEHLFPMWLAPNLITSCGLSFIVISHVVLAVYAPTLNGMDAPRWVHIFSGLSLLIYVNLDCMDGKQARRTGSSSPLGQLFDHGCDALSVGLILINVASCVHFPFGPQMAIMLFACMIVWILAQWEEYHTGMMLYGNGYFGVMEANYALAAVQLVSGIFGAQIWSAPLSAMAPFALPAALRDLTVLWALFDLAVIFMSIQILGQVYRVFACAADTMDATEKGHKQLGPLNALKDLLWLLVFFLLAYLYLQQPPYGGGYHTRALLMYVTLSYTLIATQLIMAHMAKERFAPAVLPYVGLVAGVVHWRCGAEGGEALTYGMALVMLAGYLHYVGNVVRQACEYLDISCFVLTPKKQG